MAARRGTTAVEERPSPRGGGRGDGRRQVPRACGGTPSRRRSSVTTKEITTTTAMAVLPGGRRTPAATTGGAAADATIRHRTRTRRATTPCTPRIEAIPFWDGYPGRSDCRTTGCYGGYRARVRGTGGWVGSYWGSTSMRLFSFVITVSERRVSSLALCLLRVCCGVFVVVGAVVRGEEGAGEGKKGMPSNLNQFFFCTVASGGGTRQCTQCPSSPLKVYCLISSKRESIGRAVGLAGQKERPIFQLWRGVLIGKAVKIIFGTCVRLLFQRRIFANRFY